MVYITDIGLHGLMEQARFALEGRIRVPIAYLYKSRDELNIDGVVDGLVHYTMAMDVYSWAATAFAVRRH